MASPVVNPLERRRRGDIGHSDRRDFARAAGIDDRLDLGLGKPAAVERRLVDETLEAVIEPGIGKADGQRNAIGHHGAAGGTARDQLPIEVNLHHAREWYR